MRTRLGTDLSRCLFVTGSYEPNEFALLSEILEVGGNFVDVGANEGLYTLFASRRVGKSGRVVALEPSSRELQFLERNIARNRLRNVDVVPVAASDREARAELTIAEQSHAGQSTLGKFAYAISPAGTETVALRRLDDVLQELDLASVDVVKIDVEGSEVAVLRGAEATLVRDHPLLLVELVEAALRGQGTSREELMSQLTGLGYRLFAFGPDGVPRMLGAERVDGVNLVCVHPERSFGVGSASG
ncbi:MAG: FkbM family methyltransferase [Proteobacteria bacterium]|nr:FkbM family methyltransferase [Pseudomonadota bacterium]